MAGFRTLLAKELREQWRTLRLPAVSAVFLVLGLMSPLLARYTVEIVQAVGGGKLAGLVPPPTAADAVAQFLKNLGQLGAILAILVAMGSVAQERERGTAAFVLTKPVSRLAFLAAKLVAILTLLLLGVALAGAGAYFYTAVLFAPLSPAGFAGMCALAWLMLAVYAAVTFLVSAITRSMLVAGGIGLGALVALGIVSALPRIGPYLAPALATPAAALALGRPPGALVGPLLVNAGAVLAACALAWFRFRSQEL